MNIIIADREYETILLPGITEREIENMLPLDLQLERYAEHEYSGPLPSKPIMDRNVTSKVEAGHIYYWDGWNAFVINYKDLDISPYKVVHIGEVKDKSIIEFLNNTNKTINIRLEKRK